MYGEMGTKPFTQCCVESVLTLHGVVRLNRIDDGTIYARLICRIENEVDVLIPIDQNYFSPSYVFFQQEGYLIKSCISTGLTQMRIAGSRRVGACYSSFFNLSIGLERLLKCLLIMDHMLNNNYSVPSQNQMKSYGHDLSNLYRSVVLLAENRNVELENFDALDDVTKEILILLTSFAKTKRYYNLDSLSSAQAGHDPLEHWCQILMTILNQDVSRGQIKKIKAEASFLSDFLNDKTITIFHNLDKKLLSTKQAMSVPVLQEKATKYAVLRMVQLLLKVRGIICCLSDEGWYTSKKLKSGPPFPLMNEFIDFLNIDRGSILRKKRWP